jgi:NhaP-type Na+/H+ or K+/H+ antiporter
MIRPSSGLVERLKRLGLMLLLLLNAYCSAASDEGNQTTDATESDGSDHTTDSENEEKSEHNDHLAPYAVLFPSLIMTFGVMAYYILSRYIHALPYTAVLFLLGTIIGLGVASRVGMTTNDIHVTAELWNNINSEVLLLVFLPGLIFKDSLGQNPHLFTIAIWQLLIFAFPLVLAGTALTAMVGYYVFPYGWSFSLAMTFGSILAATDPVAVAALLDEVGR